MKKLVYFLLTVVVSVGLSSCMKEGDSSFAGTYLAYVTKDSKQDLVYARAFSMRGSAFYFEGNMTSPKLEKYPPGYFAILNCSWNESYGMVEGTNAPVYKVQVSNDVEMLDVTQFVFSAPPTLAEKIPLTLHAPLYDAKAKDNFLDNKWVFPYLCRIKKGETPDLHFFFDADNQSASKNEVIVDVVLTKSGAATGSDEEQVANFAVIDFSPLRSILMQDSQWQDNNNVRVRFRFNKQGEPQNEPYISDGIEWQINHVD